MSPSRWSQKLADVTEGGGGIRKLPAPTDRSDFQQRGNGRSQLNSVLGDIKPLDPAHSLQTHLVQSWS